MRLKVLSSILLYLCLSSCTFGSRNDKHKIKVYHSHSTKTDDYHFKKPDKTCSLDLSLSEISGLSYNPDRHTILAVNDEQGLLYEIDPISGKILSKKKFGPSGDYEGIEKVGEKNYIINSSGKLYLFSPTKTDITQTPLSSVNDVEGLGYDATHELLLIACKEKSLDKDDPKESKGIYAYHTPSNTFIKEPYLLIKNKKIKKFVKKMGGGDKAQKRAAEFSPSGIAVHPITQDLYILSARENLMLVFSPEHKLKQSVFFDKDMIPQPEGICFDSRGTLFLSTEGRGKRGKIFVFKSTLQAN